MQTTSLPTCQMVTDYPVDYHFEGRDGRPVFLYGVPEPRQGPANNHHAFSLPASRLGVRIRYRVRLTNKRFHGSMSPGSPTLLERR